MYPASLDYHILILCPRKQYVFSIAQMYTAFTHYNKFDLVTFLRVLFTRATLYAWSFLICGLVNWFVSVWLLICAFGCEFEAWWPNSWKVRLNLIYRRKTTNSSAYNSQTHEDFIFAKIHFLNYFRNAVNCENARSIRFTCVRDQSCQCKEVLIKGDEIFNIHNFRAKIPQQICSKLVRYSVPFSSPMSLQH